MVQERTRKLKGRVPEMESKLGRSVGREVIERRELKIIKEK